MRVITPKQFELLRKEVGELVATHDHGRPLDEFEKWADDPVGFFREVLGEKVILPKQVEMLESVLANKRTCVAGCHASSKDYTTARIALWAALCRKMTVLVTAVGERSLTAVWFSELRRAWNQNPDLPGELYQKELRVPHAYAGIIGATAAKSSAMQGLHSPHGVLLIVSEANEVEEHIWEGAMSVTVGDKSKVIATANPISPEGAFFAAYMSDKWNSIRISYEDIVPYGVEGTLTQDDVDRYRADYGEGSPQFQARALGLFPEGADEGLCQRDWLEAAFQRFRNGWGREYLNHPFVCGLDVARDRDRSVLAVVQGRVIRGFKVLPPGNLADLEMHLREALNSFGIWPPMLDPPLGDPTLKEGSKNFQLVVDATGIGAAVADELARRTWPIVRHNGGEKATRPGYVYMRDQVLWELRESIRREEIAIEPNTTLMDELVAIRWSADVANKGKIRLEQKKKTRIRLGGRSTDFADAASMAWGIRTLQPFSTPGFAFTV
jgi:hypothetical protein